MISWLVRAKEVIINGLELQIRQLQIQMKGGLIIVIVVVAAIHAHPIRDVVSRQRESVSAYAKQTHAVEMPFKKCFKVDTDLQVNQQFIYFKPTRLHPNGLKKFSLKNVGAKVTVLEELLSPIVYKHSNLLVFDDFLMTFLAPRTVIVGEETEKGFQVQGRYQLKGLDRFDKFKIYKVGSKGLLVVYNQKKAYLLGQNGYEVYNFEQTTSIVHLDAFSNDEFYAAQFMKGLSHYKIDKESKSIRLIQRISGNNLNLPNQFKYVVDVSLSFYNERVILALDAQVGLVQLSIKGNQLQSKVVVSHKSCQSFDTIQRDHIVLLCQNQGHSTIIQLYREYNRKTREYQYRKLQPIFQANYLNDLHVTDTYFLVYSYKRIHVFWNTKKNHLPEMLETKSQIELKGLETFTFVRKEGVSYLYTVQGGVLGKYRLEQRKAELSIKSETAISKSFKLFMYGSCEDLDQQEQTQKNGKIDACRLSKSITMDISEEQYSRKEDFGVIAFLIALIVMVFLLIIWICLRKYKTLEGNARTVLSNYQNRKARGTRQI